MFNKINEFKDSLKALKELEKNISNLDMSDPEGFLKDMGIDIDELDERFEQSIQPNLVLKYVNKSENQKPEYAYPTDSGFDLRANETVTLKPLQRALVPTGLFFDVPKNMEIQVRPKSGLAIKRGLTVLNTPGTVDYGYTGEIKVILINLSDEVQEINVGDKVAQAVICPVTQGFQVDFKKVYEIQEKDRSENGFGSTGN
jgi:dUTP pyrophosphatase